MTAILQEVQFPASVITAATMFIDRATTYYEAAKETWDVELVKPQPVAALELQIPVNTSSPQFRPLQGSKRFRQLGEFFHKVKFNDPYQDGAQALLSRMQMDRFAFANWMKEADRIMLAGKAVTGEQLVALIMAGNSTLSFEPSGTINIFDTAHPVNPLDLADVGAGGSTTWSNLHANLPLTYANARELLRLQKIMDAPGGGYRDDGPITHVLVGPDLDVTARDIFEREKILIVSGSGGTASTVEVENKLAGERIKVIVSRRMTIAGAWFPMSIDAMGSPWESFDQVPINAVPAVNGASVFVPATEGNPFEWAYEGPGSHFHLNGDGTTGPGFVRMSSSRRSQVAMTWPAKIHACYSGAAP